MSLKYAEFVFCDFFGAGGGNGIGAVLAEFGHEVSRDEHDEYVRAYDGVYAKYPAPSGERHAVAIPHGEPRDGAPPKGITERCLFYEHIAERTNNEVEEIQCGSELGMAGKSKQ